MSSPWNQIKSYSGITAIVSLYGIASLLVVFLGPSLGFGLTEQIIIIFLLLLTWPIAALIIHLRNRRKERKAARESGAGTSTAADLSAGPAENARVPSRVPSRVYSELTRGVEEVVQWLRSTRLSAVRRGDPVYSLPWFLVAGAPGSGKTSLLLSSGLDFHALPSQRHADQNLIRPTRDVDWRVTDWCVFLDSTGRYQTEGPDGEEWSALVETIVKRRKRRPLDGLIIAADAGSLLLSTEAEIEQQAKILRARLDQLNVQAQARFPVYLVFTHAESLEGFEEFFRLPDAAERGQVWGTTIPLAQSASAHALFDVEFDYLHDMLMRYRLLRLSANQTPAEQLLVFDFPLHFADARRRLGLFTSALFRPNPFSESPLLRGFYFTSGAPAIGSGNGRTQATFEPTALAGEGCFSDRLFNDVLLRDKDLAASFQQGKNNPARLRNAVLAVAAGVLLFVIGGLIASASNNLNLIDEARRAGSRVASYSKDVQARERPKDYASVHAQLQDVDRLREMLVSLDEYDRDWPPFYYRSLFRRFGLYSGRVVSPYLRTIYFEAISQRFLEPAVAALEADLKSFNPSAPPPPTAADSATSTAPSLSSAEAAEERLGQYYDLLKVYWMVSRYPKRAVPSLLIERLGDHWKESAPREDEALALSQLEFFANKVALDDAPHIEAKEETVRTSCIKLESFPAMNRYYKRAIDDISSTTREVTLDELLGGKKGVIEGTARVKGAFTSEGYKKMLTAIQEAETGISQEDWVCHNAPSSNDQRDIKVVKSQYAGQYSKQYIDAWRKFLKDAKVAEYTQDGAARTLEELSKNDSPLERVMGEVARQTNLYKPSSFFARINPFSANKSEIGSAIAKNIETECQSVIKFVSSEGGIVGSSRVDLQACKLEYSIVSPK